MAILTIHTKSSIVLSRTQLQQWRRLKKLTIPRPKTRRRGIMGRPDSLSSLITFSFVFSWLFFPTSFLRSWAFDSSNHTRNFFFSYSEPDLIPKLEGFGMCNFDLILDCYTWIGRILEYP
ncbi:hypothetical protein RJT34_31223 [Clitoria ternatea]|uniref:Uncharacterized protein n=1 Tax=Clitoria ternatea TaxID=43366 RepID=A0AAN9EVZ2_CLITE